MFLDSDSPFNFLCPTQAASNSIMFSDSDSSSNHVSSFLIPTPLLDFSVTISNPIKFLDSNSTVVGRGELPDETDQTESAAHRADWGTRLI